MIAWVGDAVGAGLLVTGTTFCVLGVLGVLRMPDFYSRVQCAGLVMTLGAGGILLSLLFLAPDRAGIKAVATAAFLALTSPMVAHVLARTAYRSGVPLADGSVRDDLAEDLRGRQDT